ncbi:MAG: thioredoxin-dependent thiol peroxidase [Deltaproteobacteria bacterium]|nr:thioredoxin-dependent thiol peroxidase [Deltaproteobacteria bacterium]
MLKVGDIAPAFNLLGVDEKGSELEFSLKSFSGKRVVLYFYPRDSTPGCTTEACDFRDNLARVKKTNAIILGISPDSPKSHLRFQEKQNLNFPLLSDPDKKIAELYGAYGEKKSFGKTTLGIIRSTFIIDASGKVEKIWRKVKVKGHASEVLLALENGE